MERVNRLLRPRAQSYEQLPDESGTEERHGVEDGSSESLQAKSEGSRFEYVVFTIVGVAMYVYVWYCSLVRHKY